MADALYIISIIAFGASGLFFVTAIILWIVFNIPFVIGDLSGRNARKSIEQLRIHNERTGNKSYRPSQTNLERGKVTSPMINTNKLSHGEIPETGLLNEVSIPNHTYEKETVPLYDEYGTEPLDSDDETTTLLTSTGEVPVRTGGKKIELLEEVMLIHTREVVA